MPAIPDAMNKILIRVTDMGRFIGGTKLRKRIMHRKYSIVELDTLMATQNHKPCHNHAAGYSYMKSGRSSEGNPMQLISKEHIHRV